MSEQIKSFFKQQQRDIESTPLLETIQNESCRAMYKRFRRKYRFQIISAWCLILLFTAALTYILNIGNSLDPSLCSSERDKKNAMVTSLFFGLAGADRFYLGYVGLGGFKLLTWGGAGIWWVIDVVLITMDILPDAYGCALK